VTGFSLAVNRTWTGSDGETRTETTWFRVSAWGRQAEICNQYLSKGRQVLVEGRLTVDPETGGPRIWFDNEGNARTSFEVTAFDVRFLGNGYGNGNGGPAREQLPPELSEDEIPF
jgi:single-strand DNA-binding protein